MARRGCGALLALLLLGAPAALGAGRRGASEAALTGVVNLNQATAEQLDLLPGVGPKVAGAILARRTRQPFRSVEELVRVRGLGRKRVARLRPFLTLSGESTLRRAPHAPAPAAEPRTAGPAAGAQTGAQAGAQAGARAAAPAVPTAAAGAAAGGGTAGPARGRAGEGGGGQRTLARRTP